MGLFDNQGFLRYTYNMSSTLKQWTIYVLNDAILKSIKYKVLASTALDARVLAFCLDGGFPHSMTVMTDESIELVKMYTDIGSEEG